jgi:hypothetical protein
MRDTKMTKTVGEHWVCAELARRGWAPALTRDGLERTDILAVGTHLPDRPTIEVQVKTATEGRTDDATSWPLGTKSQQPALNKREWFALVMLPEVSAAMRCFIVPRDHVAAGAWIQHMRWLTDPTAPRGARNAPVDRARTRATTFARYEGRWDLLDKKTDHTPVLLRPELRDLAQTTEVGLPPDHPWRKNLPDW